MSTILPLCLQPFMVTVPTRKPSPVAKKNFNQTFTTIEPSSGDKNLINKSYQPSKSTKAEKEKFYQELAASGVSDKLLQVLIQRFKSGSIDTQQILKEAETCEKFNKSLAAFDKLTSIDPKASVEEIDC